MPLLARAAASLTSLTSLTCLLRRCRRVPDDDDRAIAVMDCAELAGVVERRKHPMLLNGRRIGSDLYDEFVNLWPIQSSGSSMGCA